MTAVRLKTSSLALEIPDRAFAVLTGPGGSGKTELLRFVAGLENNFPGELSFAGKDVTRTRPAAREVAMVFPEAALYPSLSVRDNIGLGLKRRKFSRTETTRRVEDAAAALGIAALLEQRPAELSPVQRQRVSIARAAARQPKVILMDEPIAQFERATRAILRAELRKLHERLATTILYATRDPAEAMALAERIVILREGKVEQQGAPAEVYAAPANLFVAGFLGAPPMNLIHGTLKLERAALLFREAGEGTIEVRLPLPGGAGAEGFAGRAVVLGVRPEDLRWISAPKGQEPATSFPALIDDVEVLDGTATFYLQTGAHQLIARGPGGEAAGRRGRFGFEAEKAHLFDPASGRRITGA